MPSSNSNLRGVKNADEKDNRWSSISPKRVRETSKDSSSSSEYSQHSDRLSNNVQRTKRRHRSNSHKRSRGDSRRQVDRKSQKYSESDVDPSHCLGIFGLSSYTEEKGLKEVFSAYGDIDKLCLIYDKQSGHSKGFGFVYFKSVTDAIKAKRETQGLVLDGRTVRVDYSLTLGPHSPTPGRYRGHRRYSEGLRSSRYRYDDDHYHRSQHQRRNDNYSRSRRSRDVYDDLDYERRSSKKYSSHYGRH